MQANLFIHYFATGMKEEKIVYKNNTIAYTIYGSGAQYIACFHGFGQAAYRWSILEPLLGKRYTLIAFDLPFHGQTQWKNEDSFTVQAMVDVLQMVLPKTIEKFFLLGYSMGGRIALRVLQQIPQKIQKIVLLAPDGLHRNRWYRFATQTTVGRRLFYRCMKNPTLLFSIAKKMRARGALSENYYNIAQYYVGDEPSRMALYRRWMSTRRFQPNLALLKNLIAQYHIPVEMVFGKYDKIIVADRGIVFAKGLEKYAHVQLLETGHHFLTAGYAPLIASLFDGNK